MCEKRENSGKTVVERGENAPVLKKISGKALIATICGTSIFPFGIKGFVAAQGPCSQYCPQKM
jgi:hypothetical protein